jgi:hypothetical protein
MSKRPTYADLTAHGLLLESTPDRRVYRHDDAVHTLLRGDDGWEVVHSVSAARFDAERRAMPHRRQVVVLLDLQDEVPDRDLGEYASVVEGLLAKERAGWVPVPLGVTVWGSWREFVQDLKEGHVTGEEAL